MKKLPLSKRDQNNQKNREKLRKAMDRIIETYDYDTVTIRNLCTVSGVSYGSFYNLFKTKENFLCYYLTQDFMQYMDRYYQTRQEAFEQLGSIEKSVDIFVCCAAYNMEKGLTFISAFYSPRNESLFPDPAHPEQEYSFTPLLRLGRQYLSQAKEEGLLRENADIETIIHQYVYLFNGITFNWCISRGKVDIERAVRHDLTACVAPYTAAL